MLVCDRCEYEVGYDDTLCSNCGSNISPVWRHGHEDIEELTDTQKELHSLADELEHLIEAASTKDDDWYIINNLDGSVTHRPTELTFMYSNGNGVHKLHTAKMQGTGTYMDLSDLLRS